MNPPGFKAEKIIQSAIEGIEIREQDHISIDDFLDNHFRDDVSCRPAVTNLLFTYYRQKAAIERLLHELAPQAKNKFKPLLGAVMTQIYFMDGITSESAVNVAVDCAKKRFGPPQAGFVNAILRRAASINFHEWRKTQKPIDLLPISHDLKKEWKSRFSPAELEQMSQVLLHQPPFTFRLQQDIPEAELVQYDVTPLPLPDWSGNTRFYQSGEPGRILNSNWLEDGLIYVQDPATAMAPNLLQNIPDNSIVLDMCSAPGGKSLMLAEKIKSGHLIAADSSWRRQLLTYENFQNAGCDHPIITASAMQPPFRPESFDVILLDVPCSNTGVGRHRPDALWGYSRHKAAELVEIQHDILENTAPLLKKGGQLIYSTCSLEQAEDEKQMEAFLKRHPEFMIEKQIKIMPALTHDGAYAALLLRQNQ